MDIPISITLSVASIIITLLIAYLGFARDVIQRLSKLESNDKIYWQVIGPHLATIIHSPTHKERDTLVDKLIEGSISNEETKILECLLELNIKENHDEGKKLASALLLARTKTLIATRNK